MRILNESEIFTAEEIKKIEKLKNASYVCESCVKNEKGDWIIKPITIFYTQNIDPVFSTRYFGIYFNNKKICIVDASSVLDEPIIGVIADNGDIIYSRHRWDYRKSPDGSVYIDGGRDFKEYGEYHHSKFVNIHVVDGKLIIKPHQ